MLITVMNAFRKNLSKGETFAGKIFLSSGLGGMSGAQPKAGNIAGCVTVCAEVNPIAAYKRFEQGWVDEITKDLDLINRYGIQVVAVKETVPDRINMIPTGHFVLKESDIMILLGSNEGLDRLRQGMS